MYKKIKTKLKDNKKFYYFYLQIRYGYRMILKRLMWKMHFAITYTFKSHKILGGGWYSIPIIVSLTSFPQRIKYVKYTIYSIFLQTHSPQKILLWLSEEQFPNKQIPKTLLNLQKKSRGVLQIAWYKDIKSYKKLIPTLKIYPDKAIVTMDDDMYYHKRCLEFLWKSYQKFPHYIHSHLAVKIKHSSYIEWKEVQPPCDAKFCFLSIGCAGILYPPKCFHKDILNEDIFTKIAPLGDDLFFWAMATLKGTKTKIVDHALGHPKHTLNFWDSPNLYEKNCHENFNDIQFKNILNYYPKLTKMV